MRKHVLDARRLDPVEHRRALTAAVATPDAELMLSVYDSARW